MHREPAPGAENDLEAVCRAAVDAPTPSRLTSRLTRIGWTDAGEGDWAVVLRSPAGLLAARISPFDPVTEYTAALYRDGAESPWLPRMYAHVPLDGGGSLLVLEFLEPVSDDVAARLIADLDAAGDDGADPSLAAVATLIETIHARMVASLPWSGLDHGPENVLRSLDGRLVVIDPFGMRGQELYDAAADRPELVAQAFRPQDRRHMFDIPALRRHGIPPERVEQMRRGLESVDARRDPPRGG